MVGRAALVTLLVTGCNQIFGLGKAREIDADLAPDLDKDGIQDDVDPCVAAAIDATGDLNSNGIPNADDPCPTLTAPSPDTDGDGFPDNCDPFPLLPGDRRSCFMHFSNPDLNQTLWQSRSGQPSWTAAQAGKVSASISSITAIVATEPLLEPSTVTTYKATGLIFGLQGDP